MEVFHTCSFPAEAALWAWSKAQHFQPLLAVASGGGKAVGIFTAQGVPWPGAKGGVRNIRGTDAACLAWHPVQPLLAVAWQDGALSLWDAVQQQLNEDSKGHRQAVVQLAWHPQGGHLLSADAGGKVIAWEVDRHMQLLCKCSMTEKGGSIRHVVWGSSSAGQQQPPGPATAAAAAAAQQDRPVAFYTACAPDNTKAVTVKWLELGGSSGVVQDVGEEVLELLHYAERQQLLVVTSSGAAILLESSSSGGCGGSSSMAAGGAAAEWGVVMRMKFAGAAAAAARSGSSRLQVVWAGPHTLATASDCDSVVRLLQLDDDTNYVLDLKQAQFVRTDSGRDAGAAAASAAAGGGGGVTALAYEAWQQTLAVATADGRVSLFRRLDASPASLAALEPAKQWQPQQSFEVGRQLAALSLGPSAQVLAASGADGLVLATKATLHHKLREGYAAIQVAQGLVVLEQHGGAGGPKPLGRVSTALHLAGLDVARHALLLHDGQTAQVYAISEADSSASLLAEFAAGAAPCGAAAAGSSSSKQQGSALVVSCASSSCCMALFGDSVYRLAELRVEACNFAGVVKQTLVFDDAQGQPLLLDCHSGFLAVLTCRGVVRVFRLAGREAKPHAGPGLLVAPGTCEGPLCISSLRVNASGSMVCALASLGGGGGAAGGCCDPRLFVYSAELNGPLLYDFTPACRAPRQAFWDLTDPRLLAVQTGPLLQSRQGSGSSSSSSSRVCSDAGDASGATAAAAALHAATDAAAGTSAGDGDAAGAAAAAAAAGPSVAILFASAEAGLLLQEFVGAELLGGSSLLGVAAPALLLHRRATVSGPSVPAHSSHIARLPLPCFAGMADADAATRSALLDFNYLLAVGRHEEAFRAVAALRSPAVWRSMAHMAIKNKRLDVAEHCLGNMEHVHGARALRQGASLAQLDARVGLVAVQLGLVDDAGRLFAGCEAWGQLELLHAAGGNWQAALEVAAKQDRIRLRSVHHAYGRHLEAVGNHKAAMQQYVASGTAGTEVARMLWQQGQLGELERLALQSSDAGLLTWWARYCESTGNFGQALSCFQRAGNQLAALRIHCATGNWAAAEQLVASCQDPAAAFHLARLYEAQDRVGDALRCYAISKRHSHAARLAKRCGLDQELLTLALQSGQPAVMLDAAEHLLGAGNAEAAALLYQRGGRPGKALDLALAAGLGDVLDGIAAQLAQDGDASLMARAAEALLAAGRHGPAVQLLVRARQPGRALELLLRHEVALTEELAEALTPEKTPENAESRTSALLLIAQAAKRQGLYHLACKKYTQAGDRLKAMRALIKSGDIDKVTFFAGVSRQREVYILAANYLQTLDWRSQPELLAQLVSFYSKAGAYDSLAAFYVGCAQLEVAESHNYARAMQALQEAFKHLGCSRASDAQAQQAALAARVGRMSQFLEAERQLAADPAAAVLICQQLLQEGGDGEAGLPDVRVGDVYGLLVDWSHRQGNGVQALALLTQMQERGVVQHSLSDDVLREVFAANGLAVPGALLQAQQRLAQQQQQQQQQAHEAASRDDDGEVHEELPLLHDEGEE